MPVIASYVLDRESIRLDSYRLLCLFYANKEIARRSDPEGEYPDAAAKLEEDYFGRELTRLLLTIAVALRTLDDQMESLPEPDATRASYASSRQAANNRFCCVIGQTMTQRDVCNKIIHATIVEPVRQKAADLHEYDFMFLDAAQEGPGPDSPHAMPETLRWDHLSAIVRLEGKRGRQRWTTFLDVPTFIEAIHVLLTAPDVDSWHVAPLVNRRTKK